MARFEVPASPRVPERLLGDVIVRAMVSPDPVEVMRRAGLDKRLPYGPPSSAPSRRTRTASDDGALVEAVLRALDPGQPSRLEPGSIG